MILLHMNTRDKSSTHTCFVRAGERERDLWLALNHNPVQYVLHKKCKSRSRRKSYFSLFLRSTKKKKPHNPPLSHVLMKIKVARSDTKLLGVYH